MGHHFDAPALTLAVPRVHAVDTGGEERRFVSTGARTNLDNGVAVVERVARNEERLDLLIEIRDGQLEPTDLCARFRGEIRVIGSHQVPRLSKLVLLFY